MTTRFFYGTQTSCDSLGGPYVTLTYQGVVEEGADYPPGHVLPADAWRAFFAALNTFIKEKEATIIEWRLPPTLQENNDKTWMVRARLSVIEGRLPMTHPFFGKTG